MDLKIKPNYKLPTRDLLQLYKNKNTENVGR
jgi:hypothetical protein